jgi:transposase
MPIRTVGEYLKRWGYTPKKARRRTKKQDPEEVREWLENITLASMTITQSMVLRRSEA